MHAGEICRTGGGRRHYSGTIHGAQPLGRDHRDGLSAPTGDKRAIAGGLSACIGEAAEENTGCFGSCERQKAWRKNFCPEESSRQECAEEGSAEENACKEESKS